MIATKMRLDRNKEELLPPFLHVPPSPPRVCPFHGTACHNSSPSTARISTRCTAGDTPLCTQRRNVLYGQYNVLFGHYNVVSGHYIILHRGCILVRRGCILLHRGCIPQLDSAIPNLGSVTVQSSILAFLAE